MSNYTTESDTGILTENEELRDENEVATVPTGSRRKQGAAFGGLLTIAIIAYNIYVLIHNARIAARKLP